MIEANRLNRSKSLSLSLFLSLAVPCNILLYIDWWK